MGFRVVRNRDEDAGADYEHASLLSKWIHYTVSIASHRECNKYFSPA
jgi:hypothetical protein